MSVTRKDHIYSQSWDWLHWSGYVDKGSNSGPTPLSHRNKSDPVSGTWIDLTPNERFRLPTNYGTSMFELVPVSGENTKGKDWTWPKMDWKTSPGGRTAPAFDGGMIYQLESQTGCNPLGPPNLLVGEGNEAITKCLNEIADNKANIAENLATLSQTVRLFTKPTRTYIKGVLSLRRWLHDKKLPAFSSYRNLLRKGVDKAIAEQYLAYVYGLKPLMQDLHGIAELAREQGLKPLLVTGSGRASRASDVSDVYHHDASRDIDHYMANLNMVSRTRCSIWAKVSADHQGVRTLNQLSLINPVSLVWELVPYSFLIDWVLPIGPVLQALTAPAGLDFVSGTVSRRATIGGIYTAQHRVPDRTGEPAVSTLRYDGYNREVLTTWPRPGLWIDTDPFRLKSDGSDRIFKALALSVLALPRL